MITPYLFITILIYLLLPPPVTSISVPSIALSAPVYPVGRIEVPGGYSYEVLANDIGWHNDSSRPCNDHGNTVLNGHNPGVFSGLPGVQVGDVLTICDQDYIITEIAIVHEGDNLERSNNAQKYIMPTDDRRVTLVTCAGKKRRLIVMARKPDNPLD